MKLASSRYTYSHLVTGTILLLLGVSWVVTNVDNYYRSNFGLGVLCQVYSPNEVLIGQMGLGILSVVLSALVIENRLRPFLGGLFQLVLFSVGIYAMISSEPF